MEVFVADPATGGHHALDIGEADTVGDICNRAADALGLADAHFSVDGVELVDGDEPAAGCELLSSGSVLEVLAGVANYIDQIRSGADLSTLPSWVCDNEACVLAAVELCASNFAAASHRLQNSAPFLKEAVQVRHTVTRYVAKEVMLDVAKAVSGNAFTPFFDSNPTVAGDRAFMQEVIPSHPSLLLRATAELRSDPDLVFLAVQHGCYGSELRYASESLRNNRDFVLRCVNEKGLAIDYAPRCMKDDKAIVAASVRGNRYAFEYSSDRFHLGP